MNPKEYCLNHNMKTKEFISLAQQVAPKYSKVTHSIASDPAYGLTTHPALTRHIRGPLPNRKKPCKFTFRLLETDSAAFNRAKAVFGHETDQQAVEYAIRLYIEKAAEAAATDLNGTDKTSITKIPEEEGACQGAAS